MSGLIIFSIIAEKDRTSSNLLLGAADVFNLGNEGSLPLVQGLLQLIKSVTDFSHCLIFSLCELLGDFIHKLNGSR